jgi:hypothetical protein
MSPGTLIEELRGLILEAAPERARAVPVLTCPPDTALDTLMPFSSLIVLGTVVAVEERFGIRVTRGDLERAVTGGVTLEKLAALVAGRLSAT